jgi:hypothetical protein
VRHVLPVFVTYLLVIVLGIAVYTIVGAAHH